MINRILIQGVTSYSKDTPQEITDLKRINCFYGMNGSGKSTIARYLQDQSDLEYLSCSIAPAINDGILVYNQKFVRANFWDSEEQPGVFTVNKGNVEAEKAIAIAEEKISELKKEQETLNEEAKKIKAKKEKELGQLENKVWAEKDKFVKTPLAFCLQRKQQKKLFLEAVKNADVAPDDLTIEKLTTKVKELDKPDISSKKLLPTLNYPSTNIETNNINREAILGSSSSYLSSLIEKIGHSDWVRDGQAHFEKSNGVCPFCQELPREEFKENLTALFDETYKQKCKQLETNRSVYELALEELEIALSADEFQDEYVTNSAEFIAAKSNLLNCYRTNLALLKDKEEKPSNTVKLNYSQPFVDELKNCISSINTDINEFNERIINKPKIRTQVQEQFWQIHKRNYKTAIELVEERINSIESDLQSLTEQYQDKTNAIGEQQEIVSENRLKTTNIDTSIENIKNALISIGVQDFHIEKVDGTEARYRIVRRDGNSVNVYESLSEGEKTLITFLYFLELCKGVLKPNSPASVSDKIIVIDDPVSSLSHNFVYEIATLIQREIIKKQYKQIFILTHNLFFFHEILIQSGTKKEEFEEHYSLYRVSKDEFSKVSSIKRDDIKNEYDAYWQVVRDAKKGGVISAALPNAMRNILEHYFGFVHKKDQLSDALSNLGDEDHNFRPLLRYMSRESHSDMVNLTDFGGIDLNRFLEIFRQVFVRTDNEEHYKRMIK